jgi:hypothetical protein
MPRRIHIVGSSPRTGTTLLVELMLAGFVIDHSSEHERSIFQPAPPEVDLYLSKLPRDALVAARVLDVDPDLWILHMVRDPRDVVVSRHIQRPDRFWTTLRIWHRYRKAVLRAEGHPRFLTLRYEDLVQNPDDVQKKISEFMPFLEQRHSFSSFHRFSAPSGATIDALGGVRPISNDSIGRWREALPRLKAQLERHGSIDADLRGLGYETSDDWKRVLEPVVPDNGTSVLPEARSLWQTIHDDLRRRRAIARYRRQCAHRAGRSPGGRA